MKKRCLWPSFLRGVGQVYLKWYYYLVPPDTHKCLTFQVWPELSSYLILQGQQFNSDVKLFIYIISNILQQQIQELRHHPKDHLEELPGWVCVPSPLVYRGSSQGCWRLLCCNTNEYIIPCRGRRYDSNMIHFSHDTDIQRVTNNYYKQ